MNELTPHNPLDAAPSVRTLSHSQVETFTQCPRRWQLTKLLRVPQAPAPALIFGDAIHQALEADGRAWIKHAHRLTYVQLSTIFSQAFTERLAHDDPDGLIAERERFEFRRKALALLDAYVAQVQPQFEPVAVEEEFSIPFVPAGASDAGWQFTGRVDARTAHAIVDFKTASKPWPLGAEHDKPQASAYLWAERMSGRPATANRVTFIVFTTTYAPDTDSYSCLVHIRPTRRGFDEIEGYLALAEATARAITSCTVSGQFAANTGPLCGWCSCLGACAEGHRWLADRGRTPAVPVLPPAASGGSEGQPS